MWTDVRGAQRVINGMLFSPLPLRFREGVVTGATRASRGLVGGFSGSQTSNLISILSLERNIFLRGRSEDPTAWFLSSDGFCLPRGWSPNSLAYSSRLLSIETQQPLGSSPLPCSRAAILNSANGMPSLTSQGLLVPLQAPTSCLTPLSEVTHFLQPPSLWPL